MNEEQADRLIAVLERLADHFCQTAPKDALTAEQAAKILGVSPFTVYRLGREGELRRQKIGRSMRFLPADIEAYQRRSLKVA